MRRRQSCSGFFIVNLGHAMLTLVLTVSNSDNDHQANNIEKDIDPWPVLNLTTKRGVKIWLDKGGRKVCGKELLFKLAVKFLFLELLCCRFHHFKMPMGSSMDLGLYSKSA